MRYQSAVAIIKSTLEMNPQQAIYLSGAPGVAKTSMAFDVAKQFGLPEDRVLLFRPSLRDPVDLNAA